MDEVFGNSSTETVVSVQDLINRSSEEDTINLSENDENSYDVSNKTTKAYDIPVLQRHVKQEEVHCIRDSVIKCVGITSQEGPREAIFKVPLLPVGPLRHTQSAIVQRPTTVWTRARAHSTSEALQSKYHPYQNIPLNIPSLSPKLPSYVNLPCTKLENFSKVSIASYKERGTAYSAPSTPRGSHSPRIRNSYIQLWTGCREEPASDDDTMSSSSGTGYVSMASPYVRSPNSSILSDLAYHLSSHDGNKSSEVFCPFCPRPFIKEQNLKHHIQAVHRNELQKMACGKEPVLIQYCPRCQSRFFNLDLLPGHLLEFHRGCVVDMLDDCEVIRHNDKEMKCPFCVKKVHYSKLGEENLLYHIVQLHCIEFENLIRSLFKPVECLKKSEIFTKMSTEDLARVLSFQPGVTSTPGLSLKFKGLSCETDMTLSVSHSSLEETWTSHCAVRSDSRENVNTMDQNQVINKGILRSQTDLTRKPSVKRELRFSVPPVTSEEFFIPESPESSPTQSFEEMIEQKENLYSYHNRREIPIRVDSLSSADFIELTNLPSRKRRRLGVSLKSRNTFKKKKNETNQLVENVFEGLKSIGCGKNSSENVIATATRTFRKPKPVPPPKVPPLQTVEKKTSNVPPPPSEIRMTVEEADSAFLEPSPFGNMKLYSPLKMFRCNGCRVKYCDNESLGTHIRAKHRGFMGFLRPHFGCGVCSAKFYENKYLVKHCLQHHTSLLEIRSPKKHKITIYRYSHD